MIIQLRDYSEFFCETLPIAFLLLFTFLPVTVDVSANWASLPDGGSIKIIK